MRWRSCGRCSMTQRDFEKSGDRELEQYLKGESRLSQRYRDASGETSPPDLDEAILARSRAELRRKPPSLNRLLAPVAVAAAVVVGVNLAWNMTQFAPRPGEVPELAKASRDDRFVPAPPASEPQPAAPAKRAPAAKAAPKLEEELDTIEVTGSRLTDDEIAAIQREKAAAQK